jgi:hypothetical protein
MRTANYPMKATQYLALVLVVYASELLRVAATTPPPGQRQSLSEHWQLQSSVLVKEDGAAISSATFKPEKWWPITVPTTVLNALTKQGIYPDVRFGLNAFRVPDASDDFNQKEHLTQYSHLLGILQSVWVETSGPVAIRDPFVVTELPLPSTDWATLKISATVVNTEDQTIRGTLKGMIPNAAWFYDVNAKDSAVSGRLRTSLSEDQLQFELPVQLGPGESKQVVFDPAPVLVQPKLWWPNGYGAQPQYDLNLQFELKGNLSHTSTARFGVRQINSQMHEHNGNYGRRILINGKRIFARGGYIQPDALWEWTPERMEAEIRYYAAANLNLIYFEDIANPPDAFFDTCDRYGVMVGQCFYGCSWMQTQSKYPSDIPLVIQCTRDMIRRYRNHPSLVMYMASNEGFTREEVYRPWRASVMELDGSRFWIPSNGMPNTAPDRKSVV